MAISSTRRKTEVTERRRQVAEMYLAGRSMSEIAAEFDVNISQISRDIKAIRQEWRSSALVDFDEKQRLELARIDTIEAEGWREWDRAKDPRHMAIVQWAVEQRCKILGIYAPTKNEHTGKDGGPIVVKGYVEVSPDDWDADHTD